MNFKKIKHFMTYIGLVVILLVPLALTILLFKPLVIEGIYHITLIGY